MDTSNFPTLKQMYRMPCPPSTIVYLLFVTIFDDSQGNGYLNLVVSEWSTIRQLLRLQLPSHQRPFDTSSERFLYLGSGCRRIGLGEFRELVRGCGFLADVREWGSGLCFVTNALLMLNFGQRLCMEATLVGLCTLGMVEMILDCWNE